MKLYHFTGLQALIGEAGMAVIQPGIVDLATVAAPGSIVTDGIKPQRENGYDGVLRSPLPPCVWLTTDPNLESRFCRYGSSYTNIRLTVVIPSTDRRLVYWPKYFRRYARGELGHNHSLSLEELVSTFPEDIQRTMATFYVYFGEITRITDIYKRERSEVDD
jgi:hypothetical protein